MLVIPARMEAYKAKLQYSLTGISVRPYSKKQLKEKILENGSNGSVPAWQAKGPEINPQYPSTIKYIYVI
jgi:hypothetical protein